MKVLLVNGSPHKNGCTDTALREVAGALQAEGIDAEIFWIGNEPVGGCIACGGCAKAGKCVFGGTVNEFAEKAKEADGFVFGTPVHYAAASGNMTAFLDRLFYSAPKETFCRKPAAVVTSARRAGTTAAYEQLLEYPGIMEMPIVSSCYWNNVHGSCPEDVQKDEEGLRTMRVLGRNMAWLLRCIAGRHRRRRPRPPPGTHGPHKFHPLKHPKAPLPGELSAKLTERLSQICIEKPKPQIQFAVWKGRNGLRGKEAPRTAGTRSVEAGSDAPPAAPSFPSCRKRWGRKGALGCVWCFLPLNSGGALVFRRRSTRKSPYEFLLRAA